MREPEATRPRPAPMRLSWIGNVTAGWFLFAVVLGVMVGSWIWLLAGLAGWSFLLLWGLRWRGTLLVFDEGQVQVCFLSSSGLSGEADPAKAWEPHEEQPLPAMMMGQSQPLLLHLQGPQQGWVLKDALLRHSFSLRLGHGRSSKENKREPCWQQGPSSPPSRLWIWLQTPVAGRFVIHGVELLLTDPLRLFQAARYLRRPLKVQVFPRMPPARLQRGGRVLRTPWLRSSALLQRQIGTGTELRDIRQYLPGDSMRSIAWKLTARHQKLLCREFESEVPLTSFLLLDIGQSMREGELGQRKLDYATEVVSSFARGAIDNRDPVGLISFDGDIYRADLPGLGRSQLQRILEHLGSLNQMVDPRFTSLSLVELSSLLGRYLFREGLLADSRGQMPASLQQIFEYTRQRLYEEGISLTDEVRDPRRGGHDLGSAVLRAFCQHTGLELPYRYIQWATYKSQGLHQAIEHAVTHIQGGQFIVILSDLGDILHWTPVLKALRRARQHHHHVVFFSPFSPWFDAPTSYENKEQEHSLRIVREMLTLEQLTWRRRIQRMVGTMGIPVLSLDPRDAPGVLFERLRRIRFGGRL